MVEHATDRVIRVTARETLDDVLDQLRRAQSGPLVLALEPLSVLFATPEHFRALDAVRLARGLSVTLAVNDPHRTGLALAFGYRVTPQADATPHSTLPDLAPAAPLARLTNAFTTADPSPRRSDVRRDIAAGAKRRARGVSRRWRVCFALIAGLAAIGATGTATVAHVHTAVVTITPAEQSFSRVVPFAVSVVPTDDPNALQTTPFTATIAREADAPATGKTTVPDASAGGAVTLRSRADGATTIKAGTLLKGPRDVSYALLTDVTIPGLDFVRGQLGEATAKVRATQPGPAGNLAAGFSARYSENITYIAGDLTGGTEKTVTMVSDDDIAGARMRLEAELRMRALTEINAALPPGVTALNDYLTVSAPVASNQPSAGTQADSVHVRVSMSARLPVYRNADFDALIDRRLSEAVHAAGAEGEGSRVVLPDTVVKSKPVFVDVQGALVRYFASVTGKTRSVISDSDRTALQRSLAGKDNGDALRLLKGTATVQGWQIGYGPGWLPAPLRTRMPRSANHIILRVVNSSSKP